MHGFGFQIDLKIFAKSQSRTACWQNSTEAGFLSNHKVQFWISVIWQVFSFGSPYCKMKKVSADFSVKSSWEVHWIIMFQKDAVCISTWWKTPFEIFWPLPKDCSRYLRIISHLWYCFLKINLNKMPNESWYVLKLTCWGPRASATNIVWKMARKRVAVTDFSSISPIFKLEDISQNFCYCLVH